MSTTISRTQAKAKRKGAIIVLVAAMMMLLVVMSGFAVNVAYMQLVRTELRTATDIAARAGAEALSRTQDATQARTAAINAAAANMVAGESMIIRNSDVVFGQSQLQGNGRWSFISGREPFNSIRVTCSRQVGSSRGTVPLFFGGVMNPNTFAPANSATAAQLDRDIVVVLDRSGSMQWDLSGNDWSYPPGYSYPDAYCQAPHPTLSRWAAAATALEAFLGELEQTRQIENVSLATFSSAGSWCGRSYSSSQLDQRLTDNYGNVRSRMTNWMNRAIPGGTAIGDGIYTARQELTSSRARPLAAKTIVLMTDGVYNAGRNPMTEASAAFAAGITVHTITFSEGANIADMQAVANAAGGKHFHADTSLDLARAFREIALTLPVVLTD